MPSEVQRMVVRILNSSGSTSAAHHLNHNRFIRISYVISFVIRNFWSSRSSGRLKPITLVDWSAVLLDSSDMRASAKFAAQMLSHQLPYRLEFCPRSCRSFFLSVSTRTFLESRIWIFSNLEFLRFKTRTTFLFK